MDYGIWLKLVGGIGHSHTFDGPFAHVMDFFFYVPNLLVAEMVIRAQRNAAHVLGARTLRAVLIVATCLLVISALRATRRLAHAAWLAGGPLHAGARSAPALAPTHSRRRDTCFAPARGLLTVTATAPHLDSTGCGSSRSNCFRRCFGIRAFAHFERYSQAIIDSMPTVSIA
jgi:hypothetical protein